MTQAGPHHECTRSSGEQRGITVKVALPDDATSRPFALVGARTTPTCSQLPKLMAQASS